MFTWDRYPTEINLGVCVCVHYNLYTHIDEDEWHTYKMNQIRKWDSCVTVSFRSTVKRQKKTPAWVIAVEICINNLLFPGTKLTPLALLNCILTAWDPLMCHCIDRAKLFSYHSTHWLALGNSIQQIIVTFLLKCWCIAVHFHVQISNTRKYAELRWWKSDWWPPFLKKCSRSLSPTT